jgi:hypothetical protein
MILTPEPWFSLTRAAGTPGICVCFARMRVVTVFAEHAVRYD